MIHNLLSTSVTRALAQRLATIDHFSNGRVILGLGAGNAVNLDTRAQPRQKSIPIYFAANSPRMLGLTGRYADGWVPLGLTPEMYRRRLGVVREAVAKAGRSSDEVDPVNSLGPRGGWLRR